MVKNVKLLLELRKSFFVSMEMDKGNLKGQHKAKIKIHFLAPAQKN